MQNFSFFAQFENILCLISSHRFAFKMLKNGIIIGSDHETICQDKLVTGQDQEIEYWNSKRTGPENGIMRQTSMHALCIARDSRCLPDVCLMIPFTPVSHSLSLHCLSQYSFLDFFCFMYDSTLLEYYSFEKIQCKLVSMDKSCTMFWPFRLCWCYVRNMYVRCSTNSLLYPELEWMLHASLQRTLPTRGAQIEAAFLPRLMGFGRCYKNNHFVHTTSIQP